MVRWLFCKQRYIWALDGGFLRSYHCIVLLYLGILAIWLAVRSPSLINTAEADSPATSDADVPPGFETLFEEQTNLVDVYYGTRLIGRTLATFAPGWIEFTNPAEVVKLVPQALHPQLLTQALTGHLDSNGDKSCTPIRKPGCGILVVSVAGVIFDQDRFRVDLIVARDHLKVETQDIQRYLPSPEFGLSLLQNFSTYVASNGATSDYTVNSQALIGYHDTRLALQMNVANDLGLGLSQLFADRDRPGYYYGIGLFSSRGLSLVSSEILYGAVAATTTRNREDREQVQGTLTTVFLPRPAQIEIVQNGYILSVEQYEAGNQILDTRNLPHGTYEITLRIRETDGSVREERRLFVKDLEIPPADQPLYMLEAGQIAADRSDGELLAGLSATSLLHGRLDVRTSNQSMLGGDVLLRGSGAALEAHGAYFTNLFSFRGAILATAQGNSGGSLDVTLSSGQINLSGTLRHTAINDPNDDIPLFGLQAGTTTEARLRTWRPLGSGVVTISAGYQHTANTPALRDFGVAYRANLFSLGRLDVALNMEYTHSDSDQMLMLSLEARHTREHGSLSGEIRHIAANNAGPSELLTRISGAESFAGVAGGNAASLSGTVEQSSTNSQRINVGGEYQAIHGAVNGGWERNSTPGVSANRYFLRASSGWAATLNHAGLGSRDFQASAALVVLSGFAPGSVFNILVDRVVQTRNVATGDVVSIPLTPYTRHSISIAAVDAAFVQYDENPRVVVPFPGNVTELTWEISRFFIIFGRILLPDGTPAMDLAVNGGNGQVFTDAQGYFQAEVAGPKPLSVVLPGGGECRIQLTMADVAQEFNALGDRTCANAGAAQN